MRHFPRQGHARPVRSYWSRALAMGTCLAALLGHSAQFAQVGAASDIPPPAPVIPFQGTSAPSRPPAENSGSAATLAPPVPLSLPAPRPAKKTLPAPRPETVRLPKSSQPSASTSEARATPPRQSVGSVGSVGSAPEPAGAPSPQVPNFAVDDTHLAPVVSLLPQSGPLPPHQPAPWTPPGHHPPAPLKNTPPGAVKPFAPPPGAVRTWERDHPPSAQQKRWQEFMERLRDTKLPLPVFAKVVGPENAQAVFYAANGAPNALAMPATVGLRSRHRYAFSVEGLTGAEDQAFYGTIEVLRGTRLPKGLAGANYPVPIHLDDNDCKALAHGAMLTKHIVLEDPSKALPIAGDKDHTIRHLFRYEVGVGDDPVALTKDLGTLVMVVRIGNRIPEDHELVAGVPGSLLVPRRESLAKVQAGASAPEDFVDAVTGSSAVLLVGHHHQHPHHSPPPAMRLPAQQAVDLMAPGACPPGMSPEDVRRGKRAQAGLASADGMVGLGPTMAREAMHPDWLLPREEYLHDGGDDGRKVALNKMGEWINLDVGDTVVGYRDAQNHIRFDPSNRVHLYAPRYAEVVLVQYTEGVERWTGPQLQMTSQHLLAMARAEQNRQMHQPLAPAGVDATHRASGLEAEAYPDILGEVRALEANEQLVGRRLFITDVSAYDAIATTQAKIAARTTLAFQLSRPQFPQIVGRVDNAAQVETITHFHEVRTSEPTGKPSRIDLIKRADKTAAVVGDVVTFEIEFINTGNETLRNVAIVDHLIPRLEYVKASAEASRGALFLLQTSEQGTQTLRWELKEPLEGKQRGAVRFRAKIR